MPGSSSPASVPHIENRFLLVRAQKAMQDADLAELYGAPTKRLNEQAKRNGARFPLAFRPISYSGFRRPKRRKWSQIATTWCILCLLVVNVTAHADSVVDRMSSIPYEQKTYYEKVHSYSPGKGTFRKDLNVWVYTPEFAKRSGMPLE